MFREFLKGSKRSLIHDAVDEVLRMIDRGHGMFQTACEMLLGGTVPAGELAGDEELNVGERMVRRMVIQHLVVTPQRDLSTSVALLSIVHDVERIGDYAKSLVELTQWPADNGDTVYRDRCQRLYELIEPEFDDTLRGLRDGDADAARRVMRTHAQVKELTDQVLAQAMEDAQGGRRALFYGLASRYLRRVSGHLANVASAVINPLDQLSGKEATRE